MNDPIREEQLDTWLREAADAVPTTLEAPDAVKAGVYRKLHRRIVRRIAGASATIAALLVMTGVAVFHRGPTPPPPAAPQMVTISQAEVEQLRARLAALEKKLAVQKARLELLADARQNPWEKPAVSAETLLPPEDLAHIEWEQIATMVMIRAERLAETKRNREAAAEYRRIIDDFPATSLVDTAKKQLQQLTSN
jgi:hypothetical protein